MGAYQYGFYTVTNVADSGVGSLRAAITYANGNGSANADAGRHQLPARPERHDPAGERPARAVRQHDHHGPGASILAVDGAGRYQPFAVNARRDRVPVRPDHPERQRRAAANGGGVHNAGTLTLTGCTLTGNTATATTAAAASTTTAAR